MKLEYGKVGPVGPVAPGGPPAGPVGPVIPVGPVGPMGPVAPRQKINRDLHFSKSTIFSLCSIDIDLSYNLLLHHMNKKKSNIGYTHQKKEISHTNFLYLYDYHFKKPVIMAFSASFSLKPSDINLTN